MKKIVGIASMVVGIVVFAVSLEADQLGIGHAPGFGLWQISGSAAGLILAVEGLVLSLSKAETGLAKTVGTALLVAGIVVLVLSLTADFNGMGSEPGFGLWQAGGSVGGLIVAVLGFVLSRRK